MVLLAASSCGVQRTNLDPTDHQRRCSFSASMDIRQAQHYNTIPGQTHLICHYFSASGSNTQEKRFYLE